MAVSDVVAEITRLTLPVVSGEPETRSRTRFEDTVLLNRIALRDAAALAELYDRYGQTIFGLLYRMLPDPGAAEEVCQDAFLRAWRAAETYNGSRGPTRTWLLSIARNAAIDWRRTRGKRLERETALEHASILSAAGSVEETVHRRLEAERLRTLLAALPAEQRHCLELAYWGGLTQTEIAERTGTPLGTVKNRVRLGLQRLRAATAAEPSFAGTDAASQLSQATT